MPENSFINLTEKDKFDLELIEKEISGLSLAVLAYMLLIISQEQARQSILERAKGINPSGNSQAIELATISSGISLISNVILGNVAFDRLNQLENSIQAGTSTSSITPDLNIAKGYSFTITGNILKTLGAFQLANEEL